MAIAVLGSVFVTADCTSLVIASRFKFASDCDAQERKVFLRPRQIKLHLGQFSDALRTHVANDADDFNGCAVTGDEQCLTNRVLARKNFFRPRLANHADIFASGNIVFFEITAGDERDSPSLEISRHYVVTRRGRAIFSRRHIAIGARVKRAIPTVQRNIAADSGALDAGRFTQRGECLLDKALTLPPGLDTGQPAD